MEHDMGEDQVSPGRGVGSMRSSTSERRIPPRLAQLKDRQQNLSQRSTGNWGTSFRSTFASQRSLWARSDRGESFLSDFVVENDATIQHHRNFLQTQESYLSVLIMQEKPKLPFVGRWVLYLSIFALVGLVSLVSLFLFSALPGCIGDGIFLTLGEFGDIKPHMALSGVGLIILLYMFDIHHWKWKFCQFLAVVLVIVLLGGAALLSAREFPVAPIGVFLFGTPFLFILIRKWTWFSRLDILEFLFAMRTSLWIVAAFTFTIWIVWMYNRDAFWDLAGTKLVFYVILDCKEVIFLNMTGNFDPKTDYWYDDEQFEWVINGIDIFDPNITDADWYAVENTINDALHGCQGAFILWLFPFILALWAFIFGLVLFFVGRALKQARSLSKDTSDDSQRKIFDPLARAFLIFLGLGILAIWAAAGIAGAEMSLAIAVLTLCFLGMILGAVVVIAVFGFGDILEGMQKTPLGSRLLVVVKSDWTRALMTLLVFPFFLIYLGASVLKQKLRRYLPWTKTLTDDERELFFTYNANALMVTISKWNLSSVLVKLHYSGIIFFLFVVGVVRMTVLFLSWLNGILASLHLILTTLIFVIAGLTMFLLPPVPGVPVYVAAGAILVANAEKKLGFAPALLYAIFVAYMLKLLAIVLQQKVIGEMYGSRKVWIRSAVGINSMEIKAIKKILQRPGMTIPKVAILCGAPDWPCSVLTGLLKQNVFSMLYGSLPVIFIVAPTVTAGAILLKINDPGPWKALSPLMLVVAMIAQGVAFVTAIHFIAKTIVENEAELLDEPDDQEVLEMEEKRQRKQEMRATVSYWPNLVLLIKFMMLTSTLAMIISVYMFQFAGKRCFVEFEVNDSIYTKLGGNPMRIVKPLGWVALAFFGYGCSGIFLFNRYVGHYLKVAQKDEDFYNSLIPVFEDDDFYSDVESDYRTTIIETGEITIPESTRPGLRKEQSTREVEATVGRRLFAKACICW